MKRDNITVNKDVYKSIVELARDVIYIITEEGEIRYLNPSFEEITGWKRDEWKGRSFLEILHPDDVSFAANAFRRSLQGEMNIPYEMRVKRKHGGYNVAEFLPCPFITNGKIKGVMGVARDITEQIKMQIEESEQLNFLQTILDTIPCPVYYKNRKGVYKCWNKSFESFFELSRKDIIGKRVYDLLPEEEAEVHFRKDVNLLKKSGIASYETRVADNYGRVHDFLVTKASYLDMKGNICGIVGVMIDISERKKAEKEKEKIQEQYKILVETATEAVVVAQDFRIQYVNPRASELSGFSKKELIGMPFVEMICDEDRGFVEENYKKRLAGERFNNKYAFRIVRKDKTTCWVEIKSSSINWKEKEATLNFLEDISDRKLKETKLNRVKSAMDELACGVMILNHDLVSEYINKAYSNMTKTELAEIQEKGWEQYYKSPDKITELIKYNRSVKISQETEAHICFKDENKKVMLKIVNIDSTQSQENIETGTLFIHTEI